MPKGPRGEKRPADVIGAAVKVMRIATGEEPDDREDVPALCQRYDKAVAAEELQACKLLVKPDHSATLTCEDGDGYVVLAKALEFTDFPLPEIALWLANGTIYLPSEH